MISCAFRSNSRNKNITELIPTLNEYILDVSSVFGIRNLKKMLRNTQTNA
jgi:hypothetical protein